MNNSENIDPVPALPEDLTVPVPVPVPVLEFLLSAQPPPGAKAEAEPERSRLLTKKEVAAELRICVRTLDTLLARRAIEYIRVGGSVRFSPAAVEYYKAARTLAVLAAA